jgi:DNA-binding beta-propeller fold protein YncE
MTDKDLLDSHTFNSPDPGADLNARLEQVSWAPHPENFPQPLFPTVVRMDAAARFWVVDRFGHRIFIYNPQGILIAAPGGCGAGAAQFHYPADVAVSAQGRAYITDSWNHRIQVIDTATWQFVPIFARPGREPGELLEPRGILCAGGRILVSERENHRLSFFDEQGRFQETRSRLPGLRQPLTYPGAMAPAGRHIVLLAEPQQALVLDAQTLACDNIINLSPFPLPGCVYSATPDTFILTTLTGGVHILGLDGAHLSAAPGGRSGHALVMRTALRQKHAAPVRAPLVEHHSGLPHHAGAPRRALGIPHTHTMEISSDRFANSNVCCATAISGAGFIAAFAPSGLVKINSRGAEPIPALHGACQALAAMPGGSVLAVVQRDSRDLVLLSPDGGAAKTLIRDLPPPPRGAGHGPAPCARDTLSFYMPDPTANRVAIHSLETGEIIKTLPGVSGAPCGVAADASRGIVYVLQSGGLVTALRESGEMLWETRPNALGQNRAAESISVCRGLLFAVLAPCDRARDDFSSLAQLDPATGRVARSMDCFSDPLAPGQVIPFENIAAPLVMDDGLIWVLHKINRCFYAFDISGLKPL